MATLLVEVVIRHEESVSELDAALDDVAGEPVATGFDFRTRVRDRMYEFTKRSAAETIADNVKARLKELGRLRTSKVTVKR